MNDWWTVYFDGAMNVLGNRTGIVIILSLKFFSKQICTSKNILENILVNYKNIMCSEQCTKLVF